MMGGFRVGRLPGHRLMISTRIRFTDCLGLSIRSHPQLLF